MTNPPQLARDFAPIPRLVMAVAVNSVERREHLDVATDASQMTVFETGPRAMTLNFTPGDIGYVKRNNGHYIKNTGDTDAQFLAVFRGSYYAETSLSSWLAKVPPEVVAQTLNMDEATIAKFPKERLSALPV